MSDDNCIFCKLANGDIPTNAIYEDDKYKVILDLYPATKGHALILPKDHYKNLFELPEENCREVLVLAKKMASHMKEKLGAEGFNLLQNNGEIAGQTIFHFHMHLIPRYSDDGQDITPKPQTMSEEEIIKIREICTYTD
ncbi:MAG: HIT family protein [Lachnospiraceae bacterium]|nr:HIT family protein [Lachnospiraceae bacterium]